MTGLGKDFATIYLRGHIHLTDITENYKKYQNLSLEKKTNEDESNTTNDTSAEKEFKTYRIQRDIGIKGDCSIAFFFLV